MSKKIREEVPWRESFPVIRGNDDYFPRITEERWLNGSAPDCKSVVLGSNPAPPQHTANSVSPEVGSQLG
jgi:hypothetical protein